MEFGGSCFGDRGLGGAKPFTKVLGKFPTERESLQHR